MSKSKLSIEIMRRYLDQLEAALDRNDRHEAEISLKKVEQEIDLLEEETDLIMAGKWAERIVERKERAHSPGYYVTLCVKTPISTRAIPWLYNAKFETLVSAEHYRNSLLVTVKRINHDPDPMTIPNVEGERVIVITSGSRGRAPNVEYREYDF